MRKHGLYDPVIAELKATGLEWRIEHGKKHAKVFLDNHLIGVFSPNTRKCRDTYDLTKYVRRYMRQRASCPVA
jgi:hypothetical protein